MRKSLFDAILLAFIVGIVAFVAGVSLESKLAEGSRKALAEYEADLATVTVIKRCYRSRFHTPSKRWHQHEVALVETNSGQRGYLEGHRGEPGDEFEMAKEHLPFLHVPDKTKQEKE
jgi:hypothetical protein